MDVALALGSLYTKVAKKFFEIQKKSPTHFFLGIIPTNSTLLRTSNCFERNSF